MHKNVLATCCALALSAGFALASHASAQTGGTCVPVAQRAGREFGCFITVRQELGSLPKDSAWYWHIDRFAAVADAHRAGIGRSSVVESYGSVWLFTIANEKWRPTAGERISTVGPLPLIDADSLAAVYMEGAFKPGMVTEVHRHPGVEAWFTLTGEMCLEWPDGAIKRGANESGPIVPGGTPMVLTGTGTEVRKSLVLILQDATKPRSTPAHDWVPRGVCKS